MKYWLQLREPRRSLQAMLLQKQRPQVEDAAPDNPDEEASDCRDAKLARLQKLNAERAAVSSARSPPRYLLRESVRRARQVSARRASERRQHPWGADVDEAVPTVTIVDEARVYRTTAALKVREHPALWARLPAASRSASQHRADLRSLQTPR